MAPHSTTLAWKIPWMEEPGRLQSMGSLLSDFTFTFTHWRRKWKPTPVFLPGESQGRGSLVGCCLWGRTELDTTEATQQQQQQLMICRFYFIGMQLLYNVVLVSIVQQSELAILIYIYIVPRFWISFTFRSPQSIKYIAPCAIQQVLISIYFIHNSI